MTPQSGETKRGAVSGEPFDFAQDRRLAGGGREMGDIRTRCSGFERAIREYEWECDNYCEYGQDYGKKT